MGLYDQVLWRLDDGVTSFFGQWNTWSTAIATVFVILFSYQVFNSLDPEIHPMLLARQAQPSPVRQEGESPVYRSPASPHGMPLNSGLNVKDPSASRWSRGRDGDLRDIWRQFISGTATEGRPPATGKILTVLGDKAIEHKLDDVTRQINLIGKHIVDQGGTRVAIYLPNTVELMATLFACVFYNLNPVLVPFDQPDEAVVSMLRRSNADTVIALPGAFPLDALVKSYPSLRLLIWVVDEGNKHLDWTEVPKGMGGSINVATWQDIIHESPSEAGKDLPPLDGQAAPQDITFFWLSKPGCMEEMVCFTSANIVSAVAGQLSAIPQAQRMGPSDLFLPADSLTSTYCLVLTLAALYSNASVAFNSSNSNDMDLTLATRGISPTVVVASPGTLLRTHETASRNVSSFLARKIHWIQTRTLTQMGAMPVASLLTSYNDSMRPAIGRTPGKLRLVYTAEKAGASTPKLSSAVLSDLRIFLGARIIYALSTAKVAGAVSQTLFSDYRVYEDTCSHFGPPLTCLEIFLRDSGDHKSTDERDEGEILVRGPCVANGEAAIGVMGAMRFDNTLSYV